MATTINENVLKTFILSKVGDKLTFNEAQKCGVEEEFSEAIDETDVNMLELNDVIGNENLYEQFATMYISEQEGDLESEDEEAKKEEQTKVKGKNGAGV